MLRILARTNDHDYSFHDLSDDQRQRTGARPMLLLLLEPDTFINFIHEKFSVETFDSHSFSRAVDSGNPVVLLAVSVVNFNRLSLRTHKHIVLYAWQLTIRFQFFGTVNHFGAWRKNFKYDTRRIQCILCLVFIAADRDIGVV